MQDEAILRLGALRPTSLAHRIPTSIIVPSQADWVAADVTELGHRSTAGHNLRWATGLVASVATAEQAAMLVPVHRRWQLAAQARLVWTLAARLGPAAVPELLATAMVGVSAAARRRILGIVAELPSDAAIDGLLDRIDKEGRAAAIDALDGQPERALRVLATRAIHTPGASKTAVSTRDLLTRHVVSHPAAARSFVEDPTSMPEAVALVAGLIEAEDRLPDAGPDQIPALLVSPPWTACGPSDRTVLDVEVPTEALHVRLDANEVAVWPTLTVDYGAETPKTTRGWKKRLAELDPAQGDWKALMHLALAPPRLAGPILVAWADRGTWVDLPILYRLLGAHGDAAVRLVHDRAIADSGTLGEALLPITGGDLADRMAGWRARGGSRRELARTWFSRHPEHALRRLIPQAVGPLGKTRDQATDTIAALALSGQRELVLQTAAGYGPVALAVISDLVDRDPLQRLPSTMPKIPAWLDARRLPRLLRREPTVVLPVEVSEAALLMAAVSEPGAPYAGLEAVQSEVTPRSYAALVWAAYERWSEAGSPWAQAWILQALGLVGDDEVARRLAPTITMSGSAANRRNGEAALRVLAAIGTDAALLHLAELAVKGRSVALRTTAAEVLDGVADARGVTLAELQDSLVPGFGLDDDGSTVLDYGPRRFRVGFDEHLQPIVTDEDGAPRRTLPKPSAKDNPIAAPQAHARFVGLRADVKTIAAAQIRRFEQAMVEERRWSGETFERLFVHHPLLWHLTRRLVWGVYERNGALRRTFRLAEDRTHADRHDVEVVLADGDRVGIVHPVFLDAAERAAWREHLEDYGLLQPFDQLDRLTFGLDARQRDASVLSAFVGIPSPKGLSVLTKWGWANAPVDTDGFVRAVGRRFGDELVVVADLDPGFHLSERDRRVGQAVARVRVDEQLGSTALRPQPFAVLGPVAASEAFRDLANWTQKPGTGG